MIAQVEARLPYLRNRGRRLAAACKLLAEPMSLAPSDAAQLQLAARFHDVGYLGISDSMLMKPSVLLEAEKEKAVHHCAIAGQFFACAFPDAPAVAECLWYHHERADGKGPTGLGAGDAPLTCWMLGLAEAVEAMANDRPHRKSLPAKEIIEEVRRQSGRQFHEDVAAVFRLNSETILQAVRS